MNTITMWIGDVRDVMADLPDGHADLLVTSPPFLALRSYLPADHPDKHREIGSEPTPAAFLDTLYGLSADWRRLVPEWGSICVELGDTMAGSGGAGGDYKADGLRDGQQKFKGSASVDRMKSRVGYGSSSGNGVGASNLGAAAHADGDTAKRGEGWPLAKSMCLIPHLYTIGLAYGHNPLTGGTSPAGRWRVRNVVAWARPNPPVGSLGKRNVERRTGDQKFRPATSYITIACTGTGRYFDLDAVRTEHREFAGNTIQYGDGGTGRTDRNDFGKGRYTLNHPAGAPPLDWHTDDLDGDWLWKLATAPYSGSHYAVYPLTLPRRLVLAMCPERVCQVCGWPSERITETTTACAPRFVESTRRANYDDTNAWKRQTGAVSSDVQTLGWTDCGHNAFRPGRVLDPFGGSGTTAVAAALEGRDAVLIDIDNRNIELVHRRLTETVRIVDRVDHPDRVEWTVTPASTSELAAIANGQPSLFDPPKEIA